MVSQTTANRIKANLAISIQVTFDPGQRHPTRRGHGRLVGSWSGDGHELGQAGDRRPGASVSAIVGTGTDRPASAARRGHADGRGLGSAAQERVPGPQPAQLKAVLINTADVGILNRPELGGGDAAITRIGGGEVRVIALTPATAAAWMKDSSGSRCRSGSTT